MAHLTVEYLCLWGWVEHGLFIAPFYDTFTVCDPGSVGSSYRIIILETPTVV